MSRILAWFAKRYIAGERIEDAVNAVKRLNANGISATVDNLGEEVDDENEAAKGVEEYARLLEEIQNERLDANISFKLTHLGLKISRAAAEKNAESIIKKEI